MWVTVYSINSYPLMMVAYYTQLSMIQVPTNVPIVRHYVANIGKYSNCAVCININVPMNRKTDNC